MQTALYQLVVFVLICSLSEQVKGQNHNRAEERDIDSILNAIKNSDISPISETNIPWVLPKSDSNEEFTAEIWEEAVVWQLSWEINREENRTANVDTYVLMITDEERIYVAFVNFDVDPTRIRATLTDRNAWLWDNNDTVGLMLDTFNDGRNAYVIAVNASGVQFDAMRFDRGAQGTEDDESFNFLWESSVRYFDEGYIVKITIPFNQIQLRSNGEVVEIGFYPFRLQPRDFIYRFSGIEWDFDRNCYICQFPKITIRNPGRNATGGLLQLIPYLSGLAEGEGEGMYLTQHPMNQTVSVGLDMKYQRTSSVLDLTILPDFSQIETDAFQMTSNVRFLPRLRERRPFFMERADLFSLPISETVYTRSIVDPVVGGRWSGKTDRHNWAVISVRDQVGWFIKPGPQESQLIADENVDSWNNIFRYRFDMSTDVMMGALFSDRITEDGYNRLLSYDGQFAISENHTLETQLLGSWNHYSNYFVDTYGVTDGRKFDYGYLLSFRRSGSQFGGVGYDYIIETRRLGEQLITGTGVLQRTGIQQADVNFGYNIWFDHRYVERIRPYIRSTNDWRLEDGRLLSGRNHMGLHIFGINRSYLFLVFRYNREHVNRIVNGMTLEGDFDLFSGRLSMQTSVTPDFFSSLNVGFGKVVDFTLVEKVNQIEFALDNQLFLFRRQMEISYGVEYLRLFQEDPVQEAHTQRFRIEYQLTRRFGIRNIIQYKNFRFHDQRYSESTPSRVRTFQNQLLFRYRFNYATAIHVGGFAEIGEDLPQFNHIGVQEESQWQVFFKISYLF